MSSVRARAVRLGLRLAIRRRRWGSPEALARRARRLFGVPPALRAIRSLGLEVTRPHDDASEWLAPRPPDRGVILYLHGGGYVACSPATHRPITAGMARRSRAAVYAPDYRLAPEHPYPAAVDDAERAYRWLVDRGVPPGEIVVAGDSAGGGLAVALLHRLRATARPLPAGAVLFSPWTDLTGSGASARTNDGKCAMFRPENLADFAACYAGPAERRHPEVSPLFGSLGGLPPVHIQVDADELLRDDAVRLHEGILAAGGASELRIAEGLFHCWQMLDGLIPEAGRALAAASDFARRVIGGAP